MNPTTSPPSIPFVKGQPFTLVGISSMMAHTTKDEIVVTTLYAEPEPLRRGGWRFGELKLKGKRKVHYLDVQPGDLVFAGHGTVLVDSDVPLAADGTGGFSGNACYNLPGTVEEIRTLITEKNLNPMFSRHDAVLAIPPGDEARTWYDRDDPRPVFEDEPTASAPVQRTREKAAAVVAGNATTPAPPDNVIPMTPERSPATVGSTPVLYGLENF